MTDYKYHYLVAVAVVNTDMMRVISYDIHLPYPIVDGENLNEIIQLLREKSDDIRPGDDATIISFSRFTEVLDGYFRL